MGEVSMRNNNKSRFQYGLQPSPWIIVGSVVILLVTVIVLAMQNYNREEQYMSRILSEKGAALIKTVEAGARTGMMGMMWNGKQIQTLIEESALVPDVQYITVIDTKGLVLAGSDRQIIGTQSADKPYLEGLDPSEKVHWRMVVTDGRERSFEVYKYFNPISDRDTWLNNEIHRRMRQRGMMQSREYDWCFPSADSEKGLVIIVGLDPKPYEFARRVDIRNTVIISGVLVILGFAGFVSMYWMQSYRSAKKRLQDTSAIADEVVTSIPVGLIATDKEGKIAFYNGAAEQITGLDLSKARGKNLESILPADVSGVKASLDRGESVYEKEMTCEFVENKVVPVSVSASRIINEDGQFIGQVLILRDLGEVRRLQDAIRQQEKLAAIGGLAAGVAHEIRNPLSSIKGIATYFKSKFSNDNEDKEAADVMIQEVDRLNRVISELLDLVRPTELQFKPADLNALIEHSVRLIQQEAASKDISIHLDLSPQPLIAEIDSDRLSQCLLNLYLNALQAMGSGGRLTIKNAALENGWATIAIKDTGTGILPEHLNKIFDPYFTTKAKGTGLGLAIVQKIVEAHQGRLTVRSVPGQGTRFTITIPNTKT